MKKFVLVCLVQLFGLAAIQLECFGASANAVYQSKSGIEKEAWDFIDSLGQQAIKILRQDKSEKDKKDAFEVLFDNNFANDYIGKRALGPLRRKATPAQLEEFLQLFGDYTVDIYTSRLQEYANIDFTVTGAKRMKSKAPKVAVESTIPQSSGKSLNVRWIVLKGKKEGDYRIGDVFIEGFSQTAKQRSEFRSLYKNEGGMEGLLKVLREKAN